eukprot:148964-Prorocentrum_minimum.AAC.1
MDRGESKVRSASAGGPRVPAARRGASTSAHPPAGVGYSFSRPIRWAKKKHACYTKCCTTCYSIIRRIVQLCHMKGLWGVARTLAVVGIGGP